MSRFLRGLTAGALLVAAPVLAQSAGAQQGQAPRIGFIDSRVVLRETPGYAQAESLFTRDVEGYRVEVQRLQASLDSAAQDFERSSLVLSPSARDTRRRELQTQQEQLERRAQELQQRAAARERELIGPIQQRVAAAIEQVRQVNGFMAVFDLTAPGLHAIDKSLDVTPRVIERLKTAGG
ncbi:MAG: OmpH family outer membrane protein [Gemmatimonadales bacterium]